jgi:hypothetical protein
MSAKLTTAEIDYIIDLIEQITKVATKTDFLSPEEQKELENYERYKKLKYEIKQYESLHLNIHSPHYRILQWYKGQLSEIKCDVEKAKIIQAHRDSLRKEHIKQNLPKLQERLRNYFIPRFPDLYVLCENPEKFKKREIFYYFIENTAYVPEGLLLSQANIIITELKDIRAKIEYQSRQADETEQRGGKAGDKSKKKQGIGRQQKYSDKTIKLAKNFHDDEYAKSNDDKAAWNKTANTYGFPNVS